jgi:hypothetical protein
MSALGLDDRRSAGGARAYAPRRVRRSDDDSTIRPVLERLSRGEGRVPGPRLVRKAIVHHLPPPDVETMAASSMPMLVRLAIAAGVAAAAAAVGAGFVIPHDATHAAAPNTDPAPIATLPTPVRTLAIRKGDDSATTPVIVKDAGRAPQGILAARDAAGTSAAAATPSYGISVPGDPVTAPLELWSMMPSATAAAWPDAAQSATDKTAAVPRDAEPDAATHKVAPVRPARLSHVVHRSRHHRRRAAAAPAQLTPPPESEPAQPQPVKKLPLQAAIDRLFQNSGGDAVARPAQ